MAKLNEQHIKFCEEYVANGYDKIKAYRVAYNVEDSNTASCGAYRLIRDDRILNKIKEIEGSYRIVGHSIGIDRKYIMEKIKNQLNAEKPDKDGKSIEDNTAINNAIVTYSKLTGDFAPEKKEVKVDDDNNSLGEVDLSKLTKEEREEIKERILKDL